AGGGVDLAAAVHAFLLAEQRGFPPHLCRDARVPPAQARQLARLRDQRLAARPSTDRDDSDAALAAAPLAGLGDRLAVRPAGGQRTATMVGGRGLLLPAAADGHELVLALRLHESGRQQRSQATVTAPIELAWLEQHGALQSLVAAELDAEAGRVVGVRQLC